MAGDQGKTAVDILVIGSGAGALTAAITAARGGADVLVVEKASRYGGSSATSGGGIWIPASRDAGRQGQEDSADHAFTYMKTLIGGDVPDHSIRAYVDAAPRMLDWLEANSHLRYHAVPYADYHMDVDGAREGYRTHDPEPFMADRLGKGFAEMEPPHPLTLTFGRFTWTMMEAQVLMTKSPGAGKMLGKIMLRYATDLPWRLRHKRSRRLTGGNALIAALKLTLDELGVPIRLNSAMKRLMRDERGRVTGAIVERNGAASEITARKAVILAAGGFEHDPQLRARNLPAAAGSGWSSGVTSNTGDALEAARAVGAGTRLLDSAWWAPGFKLEGEDRSRAMFVERALPSSIIVNQAARRYMNEASSYHVAGGAMVKANTPGSPAVPSWFVFDARYRGKYMLGLMSPGKPARDGKIPAAMRAILKKSDTIEGLAAEVGVAAATLSDTVARFNGFARDGKDPDFGRGDSAYDRHYGDQSVSPNPTLGPLDQAPFYAIPIYPCDLGTNGGILTDDSARVLDENGAVLRGLYAIGNCAASVMGRTYPGAGATLGPAMTFGWLAARDATGSNA